MRACEDLEKNLQNKLKTVSERQAIFQHFKNVGDVSSDQWSDDVQKRARLAIVSDHNIAGIRKGSANPRYQELFKQKALDLYVEHIRWSRDLQRVCQKASQKVTDLKNDYQKALPVFRKQKQVAAVVAFIGGLLTLGGYLVRSKS